MDWPDAEREFFELAILAIVPRLSHAVANGGWLRWTNQGMKAKRAADLLREQVRVMLSDLNEESEAKGKQMVGARRRRAGAASGG